MEEPARSSVFVAPLHITKEKARVHGQTSFIFPATPVGRPRLVATNLKGGEMTPPLTPIGFQEDLNFGDRVWGSEFHNYVRASHPFHPACDENSLTVTLPLNSGDIILVHSIHVNGWADGTLLNSGARGWFPTNYCEPYDGEHVHALLKSLTHFYDMVRGRTTERSKVFNSQDYVKGLIAGVRNLLVMTTLIARNIR